MARWILDPATSTVAMHARSNVHPIHVNVTRVLGEIHASVVDDEVVEISAASIRLETGRLESGNPIVDRETRRRVDARAFPHITGRLARSEALGSGRFRLVGDVDFLGEVSTISGRVEAGIEHETLIIRGQQILDVRDWGMQPPRLFLLRMEPEVTVTLSARAHLAAE